jgi:hypothetical protein
MDLNALFHAFTVTDNPSLPGAVLTSVALRAMWAVVLLVLLIRLLQGKSRRVQIFAATGLVIWTLLPGSVSLAHWLGMAFMLPSWMTVLLCLHWLYHYIYPVDRALAYSTAGKSILHAEWLLALLGVMLGWWLMADMLLWLPTPYSVYAWGFSTGALVVCVLFAVVPWLLWGVRLLPPDGGRISAWVLPVLALIAFVFTRLPSGNLWDALIDPWLWFALHLYLLRKLVNFVRCNRSNTHEPTTSRSSV